MHGRVWDGSGNIPLNDLCIYRYIFLCKGNMEGACRKATTRQHQNLFLRSYSAPKKTSHKAPGIFAANKTNIPRKGHVQKPLLLNSLQPKGIHRTLPHSRTIRGTVDPEETFPCTYNQRQITSFPNPGTFLLSLNSRLLRTQGAPASMARQAVEPFQQSPSAQRRVDRAGSVLTLVQPMFANIVVTLEL